jgi:3-oxoacyl-[acyl-carrier protein] reductase
MTDWSSSAAATPFAGQVAVVTGGTKGLGLAIAQALSAAGARVVAASRGGDPRDAAIDGITWDRVDVTDSHSVEGLIAHTTQTLGGPHIVVANAGISLDSQIERMSDERWQATIDTNLNGTFYTIRAAAAAMKKLGAGRIITVSSCMASYVAVGAGAYAATKAAIAALTKAAGLELAQYGIVVTGIAPGILTDGMGAAVTINRKIWEPYRQHLALGNPGTVEDIARLVTFLCEPHTTWANGAIIPADGGIAPWGLGGRR